MTGEKLSLKTKLAYGAGDLGPAITTNVQIVFLLPFFTSVAGLNPALAGDILALSKIWDAVNDPLVGIMADRTHTRWGRRRPWILLGAVPFGLSFLALWMVPFPGQPQVLFWYYIAAAVIFNTCYTAVNLPYTALTPDLTQDYDERTRLTQYRFWFSVGGSVLSAVLHPLIVGAFENSAVGYIISAGLWSLLSVGSLVWCVWGTRERPTASTDSSPPFRQQFKGIFQNQAYLLVIGIYLFSWLALQFTASIIPYFVNYWMQLSNEQLALTMLAIQGTNFLMLPVWAVICARMGKRAAFGLGAVTWIVAQLGILMLQPGQLVGLLLLGCLAGAGISTTYLIPWSMIPDVIDWDELKFGRRREGVFYAMMVFLQKMGLALGLSMVGRVLEAYGFQSTTPGLPDPVQPESALLAIRIAIGVFPVVALVISLGLAYLYPLTRSKHAEIIQALQERKQAGLSDDSQPEWV